MAEDKLITADNVASSLSFGPKLADYEKNIEDLGQANADLGKAQQELADLKTKGSRQYQALNFYPPEGPQRNQILKNVLSTSGTLADSLFIYDDKPVNQEYDKLYNAFGPMSSLMRDAVAMKELNRKFKGFRDYIDKVAEYFYTPTVAINEDKTNALRKEYDDKYIEVRDLEAKRDILASKVSNVERYINTAEKVSNIGKKAKE